MQITSYIGRTAEGLTVPETVELIAKATNLKPILRSSQESVVGKLTRLGIAPPPGLVQPVEVLARPPGKSAVLLRLDLRPGRQILLELLTINADVDLVRQFQKHNIGVIEKGSIATNRAKKLIDDNLGQLSANGKALADEVTQQQIRELYDDDLRSTISDFVSTFGTNPIIPEIAENYGFDIESLAKETYAAKRYFAICKHCSSMHLGFENKKEASEAQSKAGSCGTCGSRNLGVSETYELTSGIRKGISQGLWLESLVTDILGEFTSDLWSGIMAGLNELDSLAVYVDRTILAECKDTRLGQNDVYVTAQKAQEINAEIVLLVTTAKVHPNVTTVVENLNQGQNERVFHIISESSEKLLRTALRAQLTTLADEFVRGWLAGDRRGRNMYRWG